MERKGWVPHPLFFSLLFFVSFSSSRCFLATTSETKSSRRC
ncbi:unnamed protein product [Brassica oleracea]